MRDYKEYRKQWRRNNPDKMKAQRARYKERHPDGQRDSDIRHRMKHNPPENGTLEERLERFKDLMGERTVADLAYMAGLIDGEGTIILRLCGKKTDTLYHAHLQAVVSVCNTDAGMLAWIEGRFGGKTLWRRGWAHGNKEPKPIGVWRLNGRQAGYLCSLVQSYLTTTKKHRARLVAEVFSVPFTIQWTRGHTLPGKEVERRKAIIEAYKSL